MVLDSDSEQSCLLSQTTAFEGMDFHLSDPFSAVPIDSASNHSVTSSISPFKNVVTCMEGMDFRLSDPFTATSSETVSNVTLPTASLEFAACLEDMEFHLPNPFSYTNSDSFSEVQFTSTLNDSQPVASVSQENDVSCINGMDFHLFDPFPIDSTGSATLDSAPSFFTPSDSAASCIEGMDFHLSDPFSTAFINIDPLDTTTSAFTPRIDAPSRTEGMDFYLPDASSSTSPAFSSGPDNTVQMEPQRFSIGSIESSSSFTSAPPVPSVQPPAPFPYLLPVKIVDPNTGHVNQRRPYKLRNKSVAAQMHMEKLKKEKNANAARERYNRLTPEQKREVNLKTVEAHRRKRQRNKELKELETILKETNDIQEDPEMPEQIRKQKLRSRWAEASKKKYAKMSVEQKTALVVRRHAKREEKARKAVVVTGDFEKDEEAVRQHIKMQKAKFAEAARKKYQGMTDEEKWYAKQRRTDVRKRRLLEKEFRENVPLDGLTGESLAKVKDMMERNANWAHEEKERFRKMTPQQKMNYNRNMYGVRMGSEENTVLDNTKGAEGVGQGPTEQEHLLQNVTALQGTSQHQEYALHDFSNFAQQTPLQHQLVAQPLHQECNNESKTLFPSQQQTEELTATDSCLFESTLLQDGFFLQNEQQSSPATPYNEAATPDFLAWLGEPRQSPDPNYTSPVYSRPRTSDGHEQVFLSQHFHAQQATLLSHEDYNQQRSTIITQVQGGFMLEPVPQSQVMMLESRSRTSIRFIDAPYSKTLANSSLNQ